MSGDNMVLEIAGPSGPGKLGGSMMTVRVSADTRFDGVRRGETIGPTIPVIVTVDGIPDSDGTYRLLAIETQVR